jgi:hypothetical protein
VRSGWLAAAASIAPWLLPPAASQDPAATPPVIFVDESAESGIVLLNVSGSASKRHIVETTGSGACVFDYDSDGDMDVYVVNGGTLDGDGGPPPRDALYNNLGGGEFADVTAVAGVGDAGWGGGCHSADYDNDGDPDLYITNFGPDVLYRNEGDGTFRDATREAGLGDARWSSGAAFLDIDRDGLLDLYVANYLRFDPGDAGMLSRRCRWKGAEVMCGPRGFEPEGHILYRNEGGGTFADVTAKAGIATAARFGLGVVAGDLDDDGDPDILVASDSQENLLWVNDGRGRFADQAVLAGVALSADGRAQASMGAALGDVDGDGDEDLAVTNFSDDYDTLYRNDGGLQFSDVSAAAGLDPATRAPLGWAVLFFDYDNDGDLDLFAANGHVYPEVDGHDPATSYRQRNLLFANAGGRFEDVTGRSGPGFALLRTGRGAALGDYDDDGDLDLVVVNENDVPTVLRNDGGNARNWVKVRLVGRQSNRDGIGARLHLEADGRTQFREARLQSGYYSSHDPRLHFGLGSATEARLRVRWPSGREQAFAAVPAGHLVTIDEEKGMVSARRLDGSTRGRRASSPGAPAAAPSGSAFATRPPPPPPLAASEMPGVEAAVRRATLDVHSGRLDEAVEGYRAALARLPDEAAFGDPARYRTMVAGAHDNLGVALMRSGRTGECAAPIERALALLREVVSRSPDRTDLQRNVDVLESLVLAQTGD